MKKTLTTTIVAILGFTLILIVAVPAFVQMSPLAHAGECTGEPGEDLVKCYVPLSPPGSIPGLEEVQNNSDSFQGYLMFVYTILISVGIVLAIILTVYHGFQYSISDIFTKKINAKEALTNIAIGLGLILGAYLILFTINPSIVNIKFNAGINQASVPQFRTCDEVASGKQKVFPKAEGVFIKSTYNCFDRESGEVELEQVYDSTAFESFDQMMNDEAVRLGLANGDELVERALDPILDVPNHKFSDALNALKSTKCEAALLIKLNDPKFKEKDLVAAQCIYVQTIWAGSFTGKYKGNTRKVLVGIRPLKKWCDVDLDKQWASGWKTAKQKVIVEAGYTAIPDNPSTPQNEQAQQLAEVEVLNSGPCKPNNEAFAEYVK